MRFHIPMPVKNYIKNFWRRKKVFRVNKTIDSFQGDYFFLSNFFECPVTYNNLTYTNNEAAFQAQKCVSDSERIQFTKLNPSEAKKTW